MDRALTAARMHFVHPLMSLGIPWLVVGSSFAINLAVWSLLTDRPDDAVTGGLFALYVTVTVSFAQGVTQLFPIAMGMSLTRRAFYLGTAIVAGIEALGYGIALTALDAVENATGGWGMDLSFWAPGRLDVGNPVLQLLVFAAPMLLAAALGTVIGVVLKRWGATGLWSALIGSTLLVGGLVVLTTWLEAWGSIGTWLVTASLGTLSVAIPLAGALAFALLGFLALRRAVP
jgi:hypothetical protein